MVWWPRLDENVEGKCKSWELCQLPVTTTPTKMPDGPWQFCSCDLLDPLPDGLFINIGTSHTDQVPRLPYVLTDTISTGFTTWTTRFRFHYTVLLVFF